MECIMSILFNSKSADYNWLSNFYGCPVVTPAGTFSNVEGYFQWMKQPLEARIATISDFLRYTGYEAKCAMRNHPMREGWFDLRLGVMRLAVLAKFNNAGLKLRLAETDKEELIEYAPWDHQGSYWGQNANGIGENHTGRIIMEVRTFQSETT
jgi:ribA/ribD-fused uncharacterized protein